MGFLRLKELVENSFNAGQHWYSSFRKVGSITSIYGSWVDLSMAPGNPKPNYYTGSELVATAFDGRYGMYHGGNVSPASKHLHKMSMVAISAGVAPATFILCDYLLFYPLVDMDSTDEQYLDNTYALPRYTDGLGVQAFLVATNPYVGGQIFNMNYTNSDGVAGRMSRPVTSNVLTTIATIVNSGLNSFFIPLVQGDKGIRSVESITFYGPNGGLAALVLVKPLATLMVREITAFAEFDFLTMKPSLPRIYDGAYLNFLCAPNGSVVTQLVIGEMHVVWN